MPVFAYKSTLRKLGSPKEVYLAVWSERYMILNMFFS
jgi:hypothetical protein